VNLFTIDRATCNQDGICAEICPARIIRFRRGEYPSLIPGTENACIKCGHCVAVCPTGSFSHREIAVEQCPEIKNELLLSPEHCEHFLRYRRSIRTYGKKKVPKEEIKKLVETARYAPSGRNSQDARWLVLAKREEIANLAGIVVHWMRWMVENNGEEASPMHLEQAIGRWENGVDIIFRDAPVVIIAHAEKDNSRALNSCTLALSYLELAAASRGLGCCWAGYFMRAAAQFKLLQDALPLPVTHECFGAMMTGYPRFTYHRLPPRNPPVITWKI